MYVHTYIFNCTKLHNVRTKSLVDLNEVKDVHLDLVKAVLDVGDDWLHEHLLAVHLRGEVAHVLDQLQQTIHGELVTCE